MGVKIGFDDIMAGAAQVAKVPGVGPAVEGITPLVGTFGEKVVQGLNIFNQILAQWSKLSADPTFQQLVLSRLPEGFLGQGPGADQGAGQGGASPSSGLTQDDVMRLIRSAGMAMVQDGIKHLGDINIEELIKQYGPVKLSQVLTSLRGGY